MLHLFAGREVANKREAMELLQLSSPKLLDTPVPMRDFAVLHLVFVGHSKGWNLFYVVDVPSRLALIFSRSPNGLIPSHIGIKTASFL